MTLRKARPWLCPRVRSWTGIGSSTLTRWNAAASVRNESAKTHASRRSSWAPAAVCRSRNRSSCFRLIAKTAKPCSTNVATKAPAGSRSLPPLAKDPPDVRPQPVDEGAHRLARVLHPPLLHLTTVPAHHADLIARRRRGSGRVWKLPEPWTLRAHPLLGPRTARVAHKLPHASSLFSQSLTRVQGTEPGAGRQGHGR